MSLSRINWAFRPAWPYLQNLLATFSLSSSLPPTVYKQKRQTKTIKIQFKLLRCHNMTFGGIFLVEYLTWVLLDCEAIYCFVAIEKYILCLI